MPEEAGWADKAQKVLRLVRLGVDRWLDAPEDMHPTAVFVLGCQRSGTTMLIDVLRRSPSTWVWPEKGVLAYRDYRLRSPATIELVTAQSPAPLAIYKPLCDGHLADRLLDLHAGSKALWVLRRWQDVARSAVVKWGSHQAEVVTAIARGDAASVGWRGERISDALVEQLRELVGDGVDDHTGAVLFWYLRNSFYFSLDLDRDERVRLVRYEEMVSHPGTVLPTVFGHLGAEWSPEFMFDISGPRSAPAGLDVKPEVADLANALLARFERQTAG